MKVKPLVILYPFTDIAAALTFQRTHEYSHAHCDWVSSAAAVVCSPSAGAAPASSFRFFFSSFLAFFSSSLRRFSNEKLSLGMGECTTFGRE